MSKLNDVDKYDKLSTNRKALKLKRRVQTLKCDICPPNRGENAKRRPKHGAQKKRKWRDE